MNTNKLNCEYKVQITKPKPLTRQITPTHTSHVICKRDIPNIGGRRLTHWKAREKQLGEFTVRENAVCKEKTRWFNRTEGERVFARPGL